MVRGEWLLIIKEIHKGKNVGNDFIQIHLEI